MNHVPYEIMQSAHTLVYQSCAAMNEEKWDEYLKLCDAERFRYRVVSYTPELQREQYWADRNFKAMKSAFGLIPRHNSDHAKLTRHAVVQSVQGEPRSREVQVFSNLVIFRTEADGAMSYLESGQTRLFAVGSYIDLVAVGDGEASLIERTVRLDTRQLDIGSHKPF